MRVWCGEISVALFLMNKHVKGPVLYTMSHSQTEKKKNITGVLWAVREIVLRVSVIDLILIWPFRCKRQFYCPSGCSGNSISKGQKPDDCGLDEKQKHTISFLSPGNGGHSELVWGLPSNSSIIWGPGAEQTGWSSRRDIVSGSNNACPRS